MAMAAAVTHWSPRLFSRDLVMIRVNIKDYGRVVEPLSMVLFDLHRKIHDRVSGSCQARALRGMSL